MMKFTSTVLVALLVATSTFASAVEDNTKARDLEVGKPVDDVPTGEDDRGNLRGLESRGVTRGQPGCNNCPDDDIYCGPVCQMCLKHPNIRACKGWEPDW